MPSSLKELPPSQTVVAGVIFFKRSFNSLLFYPVIVYGNYAFNCVSICANSFLTLSIMLFSRGLSAESSGNTCSR